jgi:hypothetical protein
MAATTSAGPRDFRPQAKASWRTPEWDAAARGASFLLSDRQIWSLFHRAVAGLDVALCLHRVSRRTSDDPLTMPAGELDAFVANASRCDRSDRWLTLAFDDGYDDACSYVETRAPRYPDVDWLVFVCPAKLERRVGFRWDLEADDDHSPPDIRLENRRGDLVSAARLRDCHLATIESCRRLRHLPNVDIGNHTNCHFRVSDLSERDFEEEVARSYADFARLFGEQAHFAFPFGTPEEDFSTRQVEILRAHGPSMLWSTARRPYPPEHRRPGAVLPRFPVDGRATASQLAFWIALVSIRARARGLSPLYPEAPTDSRASAAAPRLVTNGALH